MKPVVPKPLIPRFCARPPKKARRTLEELLAATPRGLHRVNGWDAMKSRGREL